MSFHHKSTDRIATLFNFFAVYKTGSGGLAARIEIGKRQSQLQQYVLSESTEIDTQFVGWALGAFVAVAME